MAGVRLSVRGKMFEADVQKLTRSVAWMSQNDLLIENVETSPAYADIPIS